jgi:hypothetical protein
LAKIGFVGNNNKVDGAALQDICIKKNARSKTGPKGRQIIKKAILETSGETQISYRLPYVTE